MKWYLKKWIFKAFIKSFLVIIVIRTYFKIFEQSILQKIVLSGWGCAPLVASSVTVQGVSLPPSLHCSLLGCVAATLIPLCILLGCVAATLIPLRISLGCVAATLIPLRISLGCVAATLIALLSFGCVAATLIACTLWGVLLPPLFYPRVHPTTFSPIYCQRLCILSWTT